MGIDIHQPLSGKRRRPGGDGQRPPGQWRGRLATLAAIVLILGGAGWAAWSSRPVELAQSDDAAGVPLAELAETAEGFDPGLANAAPEVTQDSNSLPRMAGDSGAEISTTLDGSGAEIIKISPTSRTSPGPVLLSPPDRKGQDPRLAHLPDPAIIEETARGALPVRGAGGERAFDIYARPWSGTRGTRVAIVVGGLGLSQTGTQYALQTLPADITLAFASNGNSLTRWMQTARRNGHEILLQVPFEPYDYPRIDPGRGTLTVEAAPEDNLADLHEAMARITNYTGITNFMGGRFLSTPQALEPVMRDLAGRGIMFLDDGTAARSLTGHYAKALAMPFAASDMVLDGKQERGYILEKLDELERVARRNGTAIAVASAFEVSVETIAAWAEEAKGRGVEIVGVSALAEDPEQ